MPQLSIKGEDLNFLVYRYLVENGYQHSAFCFRHESSLPNYMFSPTPARTKAPKYPPQCLIGLVYKALLFIWVEVHTNQVTGAEIPCDAPFSLFKHHVCSQGSEEVKHSAEEPLAKEESVPEEDISVLVSPSPTYSPAVHSPALESPIPRKTSTPVDPNKKLKRDVTEAPAAAAEKSSASDNDEPISGYRRRRLFSSAQSSAGLHDDETPSDSQMPDSAPKKLAVETPKKTGARPGRPRKENAFQVIRRGPQGYVLGFRTDREKILIGKKTQLEGWRIATVLTNSMGLVPKRVEINNDGKLMIVLWMNEATECYDCHLYEIDEHDEFHFIKLGVEASQLMNIQAVRFSQSRPAFRIIQTGRREGTSIFKTFGKHEDIWKLESDVQHP
eukprot:Gregarina_sp_Pseudo_9__3376@NODE_354_length_3082_cov_26_283273_g333_i0_p1_GENE_NODE_354_length_3082_cov_26_283273_g333_i0NODE_354_length_3082_cov_26_283273_g333_i0_p1_ORF_typecomplete_len387_score73_86LisH/PF08513_11/2_6e11RBR/PF17208_3/3_1e03RBR/PF17208_3/0_91_NODE_354_length_3082_cov_26_283273_g333_i015202680